MRDGAIIALLGAAFGWLLGYIGDSLRERRREQREARAAALAIFAELVEALGNLWTARKLGVWTSSHGPRRTAWDAYGVTLLRGGDVETLAPLGVSYSSLADAEWLFAMSADKPKPSIIDV